MKSIQVLKLIIQYSFILKVIPMTTVIKLPFDWLNFIMHFKHIAFSETHRRYNAKLSYF